MYKFRYRSIFTSNKYSTFLRNAASIHFILYIAFGAYDPSAASEIGNNVVIRSLKDIGEFTKGGKKFYVENFYKENNNAHSYYVHIVSISIQGVKTITPIIDNEGAYSDFIYSSSNEECQNKSAFFLESDESTYIYRLDRADEYSFIISEANLSFDDSGMPGTSPAEFRQIRSGVVEANGCDVDELMRVTLKFSANR